MAVYPNPMTNELFIGQYQQEQANSFDVSTNSMNSTQSELRSATALGAIQIEIYNFSGILVKSISIEKSTVIPSIDVSDLRKGTYIIKITGKDIEEIHQIVKE
ncbi:T9SS type A sorting domain-containing protein [Maribacter dokdonensis]|uniref:T9SS type A sorting domain-containing protein n=1 Tax=Maribacter dokdonensis TaxID=320912 RepID=UPI00094295E8|nr:T9SS type A sorting domain-containing protein [Maribacter dokdonensis]